MDKLNKTNEIEEIRRAINDIEISLIRHSGSELVKDVFDFKTLVDAVQALEKQIPLQVGDIHGDYDPDYDCMICGEITRFEHQKYCIECGQRLRW